MPCALYFFCSRQSLHHHVVFAPSVFLCHRIIIVINHKTILAHLRLSEQLGCYRLAHNCCLNTLNDAHETFERASGIRVDNFFEDEEDARLLREFVEDFAREELSKSGASTASLSVLESVAVLASSTTTTNVKSKRIHVQGSSDTIVPLPRRRTQTPDAESSSRSSETQESLDGNTMSDDVPLSAVAKVRVIDCVAVNAANDQAEPRGACTKLGGHFFVRNSRSSTCYLLLLTHFHVLYLHPCNRCGCRWHVWRRSAHATRSVHTDSTAICAFLFLVRFVKARA